MLTVIEWEETNRELLPHLRAAAENGYESDTLRDAPTMPERLWIVLRVQRDLGPDWSLADLDVWCRRSGVGDSDFWWLADRLRMIEEVQRGNRRATGGDAA